MLLAAGLFFLSSCESKGPVAELKAFAETPSFKTITVVVDVDPQ